MPSEHKFELYVTHILITGDADAIREAIAQVYGDLESVLQACRRAVGNGMFPMLIDRDGVQFLDRHEIADKLELGNTHRLRD